MERCGEGVAAKGVQESHGGRIENRLFVGAPGENTGKKRANTVDNTSIKRCGTESEQMRFYAIVAKAL